MIETTKVFIHGNPETSAIWDLLVEELQRGGVAKIVRLSPPGFGFSDIAGSAQTDLDLYFPVGGAHRLAAPQAGLIQFILDILLIYKKPKHWEIC